MTPIGVNLVRVGSIWQLAHNRSAVRKVIVVAVDRNLDFATVRALIDGNLHHAERRIPIEAAGLAGFLFVSQQPTLRCIDKDSAEAATRYLQGRGATHSCHSGVHVLVATDPRSVLDFADVAFQNGWAHDEECAHLIRDLG